MSGRRRKRIIAQFVAVAGRQPRTGPIRVVNGQRVGNELRAGKRLYTRSRWATP